MPIYKTLEKSYILNILKKGSIFLYSKRIFFRGIVEFTSLAMAIFRVTLHDRAQIFLKKIIIYENDDSVCFHFLYTDQICDEWKEFDMKKYILFGETLNCKLQCKLN